MFSNLIARIPGLVAGIVLAATLAPISVPGVAHADGPGSLTISPDSGGVGSKFHIQGTGFVSFSLATRNLDLTVFDASNSIVDQGSVAASDDGSIDADIDTTDGSYTSGTYALLASYTYWAVRRDPDTRRIICDFCPTKSVPLADSVTFTIQ